ARNLNRRLGAAERVHELDLEIESQIRAAGGAAAPPAAGEPEEVAEEVGKVREDVGIESGAARAARTGDAGVSKAIVARAFFGIAEHGVRLGGFLEPLFGRAIARIAIGMVFQREFAVRALDVLLARAFRDAENLVVIARAQ